MKKREASEMFLKWLFASADQFIYYDERRHGGAPCEAILREHGIKVIDRCPSPFFGGEPTGWFTVPKGTRKESLRILRENGFHVD